MFSLVPAKLRFLITDIGHWRVYRRCDCDLCHAWWQAHHRTCCLCLDCRRHFRQTGGCHICEVNGFA